MEVKDALLRIPCERIGFHASTASELDYGRLEELALLMRMVLGLEEPVIARGQQILVDDNMEPLK